MNYDDSDDEDRESKSEMDILECLRLQGAELELLESMYPEQLSLDDEEAAVRFRTFLEKISDDDAVGDELPPNLSLSVKIDVDETDNVLLSAVLPSLYPLWRPNVLLRTNLNRHKEKFLRDALDEFLRRQDEGELYMVNLINFVRENFDEFRRGPEGGKEIRTVEEKESIERIWIYSHHIYSMQKRKFIMEWTKELHLTGFSMPGKPGIVCVEGGVKDVDEFWHRLRKLNWKRLAMKERETLSDSEGINHSRTKFSDFREISFDVKQGHGRNYHMDMGKFREFLREHDCEAVFKMYFGVDGM